MKITIESYANPALGVKSTTIFFAGTYDPNNLDHQLEMSHQAILFAMSDDGWDFGSLGFTPYNTTSWSEPFWWLRVMGSVFVTSPAFYQELLAFEPNAEAWTMIMANPQNEALALVFHTNLFCYRLAHDMCESPNNYGVITGVTAGYWLQSPVDEYPIVEEWGHFSVETVIPASIDIKPGSEPNCFNNDGHGVIAMAILGSDTFDVNQIDADSVRLEGMVVKTVGKADKALAHIEAVNGDGFDYLIVQILDEDGVFEPGIGEALVTGQFLDGSYFEGSDYICVTQ